VTNNLAAFQRRVLGVAAALVVLRFAFPVQYVNVGGKRLLYSFWPTIPTLRAVNELAGVHPVTDFWTTLLHAGAIAVLAAAVSMLSSPADVRRFFTDRDRRPTFVLGGFFLLFYLRARHPVLYLPHNCSPSIPLLSVDGVRSTLGLLDARRYCPGVDARGPSADWLLTGFHLLALVVGALTYTRLGRRAQSRFAAISPADATADSDGDENLVVCRRCGTRNRVRIANSLKAFCGKCGEVL
jgi:hypothetical protein